MKKTTKYIIISLASLIVLIGALYLFAILEPEVVVEEVESSSESEEEEAVVILEIEETEVVSFEVTNPSTEMSYTVTTEEVTTDDVTSTTTTYTLDGYEQYELDTSMPYAMKVLYSLEAAREIGEVEDTSIYGFTDDVAATIVINLEDGSSEEIVVGSVSSGTSGNYVLVDDVVYIAVISQSLFETPEDWYSLYYFDETLYDDTGTATTTTFEYLNFSGTNFYTDVEVLYYEDLYSYYMQDEFEGVYANFTFMENMATNTVALSTTSVVLLNATEEDLETYGLAEPMASLDFSVNGVEHQISVSSKEVSGERYVFVDGATDVIYTVDSASVETWAEIGVQGVRNSYVFMPAIMDTETVTFEIFGEEGEIALERTVDEESTTDTTTSYDYTAEFNGTETEYTNATAFYLPLISVAVLNLTELECEEEPSITVTFEYYEGGEDVLEYYKSVDEDNRYVAFLNGNYTATVRLSNLETLSEAYDTLSEATFG